MTITSYRTDTDAKDMAYLTTRDLNRLVENKSHYIRVYGLWAYLCYLKLAISNGRRILAIL